MAHAQVLVEDPAFVPEDGLDDFEYEQYQEDGTHRLGSLSLQSVVGKPSGIDYVETARSFLDKVNSDYREFRNIVTGDAADGWYATPLPLPLPPSSFGNMFFPPPIMPFPAPLATCGYSSQLMFPMLTSDSPATLVFNNVTQQTERPAARDSSAIPASRQKLARSAAPASSQPVVKEKKEEVQTLDVPLTTLMLRNIPANVTRSTVMKVLRSEGFAEHVVFIYLPMNLRSSGNFGYAFVDFDFTEFAEQCKERLDGFTGWSDPCEKALEVAWSETQGLDSHIHRYRDSPLMHSSLEDELKPAMFKNGVRIAFPPPTKPIRAPRLRRTVNRSSQ